MSNGANTSPAATNDPGHLGTGATQNPNNADNLGGDISSPRARNRTGKGEGRKQGLRDEIAERRGLHTNSQAIEFSQDAENNEEPSVTPASKRKRPPPPPTMYMPPRMNGTKMLTWTTDPFLNEHAWGTLLLGHRNMVPQ